MATFRGLFVRKDSTGVGTGPADARKALAGLLHRLSSGAPRQGLLSPVQVVGTTGWAYSVPAAWWATSRGLADGVVLAGSDGVVTVPTDPAPASGSRIDVIYVLHRDVDQADPDSESVVSVTVGVPSGTPVAPSIPAGAMEIARATVSSTNANTLAATISQTAPYTGLAGADIVVPGGLATFDAAVPNAAAGTRVYSIAENAVYVRAGGAWARQWGAGDTDPEWTAIPLESGWKIAESLASALAYRVVGGVVHVRSSRLGRASALAMSPAVYYTLGSLPAAASPPSTYSVPATIGIAGNITTLAEIRFQADGLIRAFCLTSGTMSTAADVGNSLAIPAQSWPRKPQ